MSKEEIMKLIEEQSVHAQGSNDWFRDRLGCITSSCVHYIMTQSAEERGYEKAKEAYEKLLSSPFKKGETPEKRQEKVKEGLENVESARKAAIENPLSDQAKTYLRKVAADRNLMPDFVSDDELFGEYLQRVNISNKAIRYGSDNEDIARKIYEAYEKTEVLESGFIRHMEIDNYGDSPDGTRVDGDNVIVIEIKFPNPDTWIRYAELVYDAESLKEEKPEYYWQCMSHIECNREYWKQFGKNVVGCDFIFCDKMQKGGYRKIHIKPNEEDIKLMKERIIYANKWIDDLLEKIHK